MSTGLATISRMPSKSRFVISGIMVLKMAIFCGQDQALSHPVLIGTCGDDDQSAVADIIIGSCVNVHWRSKRSAVT